MNTGRGDGVGDIEAMAVPTVRHLRWAAFGLACLGLAQAIRFLRLAVHEGAFDPGRADWATLGFAVLLWIAAAGAGCRARQRERLADAR